MSRAQVLINRLDESPADKIADITRDLAGTTKRIKDATGQARTDRSRFAKAIGTAARSAQQTTGLSGGKTAAAVGGAVAAGAGAAALLKRRQTLKKAGVTGKGGAKEQYKSGGMDKSQYKAKKKELLSKHKQAKQAKKYSEM